MLFAFFGHSAVSNREADGQYDEHDLHGPDEHIHDPSTPACDPNTDHHVDSEDPSVLCASRSVF